MSNLGWSTGQRAAVKRWMLFASLFAIAGVILAAFLIISGNSGGWVILGMVVCISLATFLFVGNQKKGKP
ncbi:hypothetical protein [Streptomyces niveus]|nr:hypothetical protein [Streptomyces niveus]